MLTSESTTGVVNMLCTCAVFCTVLTSDGGGAAVNMWRIRVDQWTTHLSINFSNKYSYRILRENMFQIILMNYNLTFSSLLASSLYVHSTFDMR